MRKLTVVAFGATLMIGAAPLALAQTEPPAAPTPGEAMPEAPGAADVPDVDVPDVDVPDVDVPDVDVPPEAGLEPVPEEDDTAVQEMDKEQMRSMLLARGMDQVDALERDGDHFVTTAEWFGESVTLRLDVQTGEIIEPKYLSENQIANQLRQVQGYEEVTSMEMDGDYYIVTARRGGFDYILTIDARSGAVVDQRAS